VIRRTPWPLCVPPPWTSGVRAALGASAGVLVAMVVGQAMRIVVPGIGIGLLIAVMVGGRVERVLFQVAPHDTLVGGTVIASLVLATALAAWIPSLRATRVNPAVALRAE